MAGYFQTYIERDVRTLTQIGNLDLFQRFVKLCAARSGQILNLSSLASDAGISSPTARAWLSILQTSYLVFLLTPHARNFSKRLIKAPKLYFLDTGLLCYLLRIQKSGDLMTHAQRGAIFESWVVSELYKYFIHRGEQTPLYFWRDQTGHEVDVLAEIGDTVLPIEIKSGQTLAGDSFKGLYYWLGLGGNEASKGMLVYAGDSSYERQNISVRSWWQLP